MRILAVDDDPLILDLVSMVLKQQGHDDICTAGSSSEALTMLGQPYEAYDVLILDIDMPEMDGVALCRRIRQLPAYQSTPIIMLTAKSDAYSIEQAFGAGANDYITKPFDVKDIGTRLEIAKRMMWESRKTFMLGSGPMLGDSELGEFGIDDPVRITGLYQHTDTFSLGNYLSQLARRRVDESSVFAAKINSFEDIFATCSTEDLLLVLAETSKAISLAAQNKRLLNAYMGSGIFMCIATDDVRNAWPGMEDRVDGFLKSSRRLRTADMAIDVSVTIGRPFRPIASKTKRVRQTFDRAVSVLERRLTSVANAN